MTRRSSSPTRESRKPTWAADLGRPIVLVGFMGSGKSTVGRRLAAILGVSFVDLDEEIERAAARTIAEIFRDEGEAAFRDRETRALLAEMGRSGTRVVASGAGVLGQSANREALRGCLVVWLDASFETCWGRAFSETRPMLAGGRDSAARLFGARRCAYRNAAIARVRSDLGHPEDVARRIAARIRPFAADPAAWYR